jgi:cyclic beta-1,2-glucan synthetase
MPIKLATATLSPDHLIRHEFEDDNGFSVAGARLAKESPVNLQGFADLAYPARMESDKAALLRNYLTIAQAARSEAVITPAAEWLLDNHHIVEENFRLLRAALVPKYYRTLPTVQPENGDAIPAVLALAWRYVGLSNSEVSSASLTEMVEGVQSVRMLTIGELWAVPAMLRFVLLENLRRVSDRVALSRRERAEANRLADRIVQAGPEDNSWETAQSVSDTFAAQLVYRLRDGSEAADRGLAWLDAQLAARGTDSARIVQAEHSRQSAANVIAGNVIGSLKTIGDTNWTEWFEGVSQVDAILRQADDFPRLDRPTRNGYRDTIERIARRSDDTEIDVAARAVRMAHDDGVGHLLVGNRLQEFEQACGYRPRYAERIVRAWARGGWLGIFGPALVVTVAIGLLLTSVLPLDLPQWAVWLLFISVLLSASEAGMGLVNLIGARLVPPRRLPAIDYKDGIPDNARTLVVIPSLISNFDTVDELADMLELHYLANPDGAVDFALLTDWLDSDVEIAPNDREVLAHAQKAIEALAAKYANTGRRFYLLHRARIWNATQGVWMGWERKRGKLSELNDLLLGNAETTFMDTGARPPEDVRFVVTLDSDTRLPRGTVAALVGKMMHPVNRPVTDPATGLVVSGHAVLQPRVTPSLTTGVEASAFQRIFSAGRGMDPYVFTVSDLYQDLLDSGSFAGKGIYDVAAFEAAMAQRFPENAVLSHDLLEGTLARAALTTDVQMVEDFPIRYDSDAARQHRWVRGDWQLLPFILDPKNGIDGLGRMKMVDNLRRSLMAPSWVLASVLGWLMLPPDIVWIWQLGLLATLFFMPIMTFQSGLLPSQKDISAARHLGRIATDLSGHLQEIALRLIFMPHQAAMMADAILRTLWRLCVSRRNLLEWRTARQVHDSGAATPLAAWKRMIAAPAISLLAMALTAWLNPVNLPIASLFALLWLSAPAVAQSVSRSMETEDRLDIAPQDAATLRRIARTTWRFFETFVTEQSQHLPPDNYQDLPEPKLAERTSPTNIGLYLLSVLTARDMGWIGIRPAVTRIGATLDTLERMERYKGHWYNWYDTRTLAVLEPRYISSVDSGNLAGHLITLASALKTWSASPSVFQYGSLEGIGDTLAVLTHSLQQVPNDRRTLRPLRRRLEKLIEGFAKSHTAYIAEPQLAPVRALNLVVIAADITRLANDLNAETGRPETAELVWWARALQTNCEEVVGDVDHTREGLTVFAQRMSQLAERARRLAFEMDFTLLMNAEKRLLTIGYRPETQEMDRSCYDLLASEARLASLFAIAKGDLPTEHWLRLGRPVTAIGMHAALLSWSGSMFEYLMPPLVMHERTGGILNASNALAVTRQIRDGKRLGLPWGVSESAFSARDRDMNYQYHAFGSPDLALKRVALNERVVAPYATLLAAQIVPAKAVANLRHLDSLGAFGPYGYFDAVDFTASRLPEGQSHVVVRNVMAHHHGMSMVAIANAVLDGIHRDRFHSDEVIRAAELLLQEKAPREVVTLNRADNHDQPEPVDRADDPRLTISTAPAQDRRIVALLSNGRLAAQVASTGAGSLRYDGLSVTRWRPDLTVDTGGIFLFLRDVASGQWWSATTSPRSAGAERARAVFSDHKAEFHKTTEGLETLMEVIVASEAAAEGRRLTLRNTGTAPRTIEVTSYGEIVLDREDADLAHPAFSKMFVRTAIRDGGRTITAFRNPRAPGDRVLHMAHLVSGTNDPRPAEAETDRRAFIGRGRTLGTALAFDTGQKLSGAEGFTLDPIFAIRHRLTIPAGKEASMTFWTLVADSAEEMEQNIRHFRQDAAFDHEARMAWTMSQVQLRHTGVELEEAALFRNVAAALIWPDPRLAVQDEGLRAALGPQNALWPMGISGDRPILLLRTDDESDLPIVRSAVRMADYFRLHGLAADLVILNERRSSYVQDLQTAIQSICDLAARAAHVDPDHRAVFPVRRDQMSEQSFQTLLAVARIVLHTRNGKISEQLARIERAHPEETEPPVRALPAPTRTPEPSRLSFPQESLDFWNGYGGFAQGGREYVVRMRAGERTPQPWINVIAREDFGFHVSAAGAGFTWSVNSRDYQLTPWSNDPVINQPGEAILIRNEATGQVISPFAALSEDPSALHETRHGMGKSVFRVWTDWVEVEAVMTLAADAPARLTGVTLRNRGRAPLKLDVIAYAELVLGNNRGRTAGVIRAAHDASRQAVVARNPFATEIAGRVTALAADRPLIATCVSRQAFLGRDGKLSHPESLAHWPDTTEPEGDPCLAAKVVLDIAPGASETVTFLLADSDEAGISDVIEHARAPGAMQRALQAAEAEWSAFLGHLQVTTPDPKFDLMVNTWLPYQSLSCRIRGRSAFYQASGAFGFRDQLQDTSAWILQDPTLARAQILNAASRQFPEGDVQHWWLPRTGAGVRTTISDDVVWLAHITARYIDLTADHAILDEALPFLAGPVLHPGQHDAFFTPTEHETVAPLYDHCAQALDLSIARTGANGLPLMLGGDWNDGMNRVGEQGRGESVWLGWFLLATLDAFVPVATARGDSARAQVWQSHRAALLAGLEDNGWDGEWYRRAFYDDGTPLGSRDSDECRIDSIAQSWATISGAGDPARAKSALDQVMAHLADPEAGLLRLFTPPLQHTEQEPGYIKGYPPGVRENGGQYTHAATWVVHALGRAGRGTEALEMFNLINPISHAETREDADRYRVEPYVVAADIYGADDKIGRGGWTWYTGSAGWLYRAAVEGILGIQLEGGNRLRIAPALPDHWPGIKVTLKRGTVEHLIEVERGTEALIVRFDGEEVEDGVVELRDEVAEARQLT